MTSKLLLQNFNWCSVCAEKIWQAEIEVVILAMNLVTEVVFPAHCIYCRRMKCLIGSNVLLSGFPINYTFCVITPWKTYEFEKLWIIQSYVKIYIVADVDWKEKVILIVCNKQEMMCGRLSWCDMHVLYIINFTPVQMTSILIEDCMYFIAGNY